MAQEVVLESSVGYALKQAAAALRAGMDAALAPLDLTVSQYACLELLTQRPGVSGADLARGSFMTRQSMQTLLQGLQDRGLLDRPTTAPHGRALPTELTPRGRDLARRASAAVADVEQRMLKVLLPGGPQRLLADLQACTSALSSSPA